MISPTNVAYPCTSFRRGAAGVMVRAKSGKRGTCRCCNGCVFSALPSGRSICNRCRSLSPQVPYPLTPCWKTLPQVSGKVGGVASLRRLGKAGPAAWAAAGGRGASTCKFNLMAVFFIYIPLFVSLFILIFILFEGERNVELHLFFLQIGRLVFSSDC